MFTLYVDAHYSVNATSFNQERFCLYLKETERLRYNSACLMDLSTYSLDATNNKAVFTKLPHT